MDELLLKEKSATQERTHAQVDLQNGFLRQVFAWMFVGLGLTTSIAVWFYLDGGALRHINNQGISIGLIVAQLGLVAVLSWAMKRISASVATFLFCLFAGVTGCIFSILLEYYTTASIVGAFAGATAVFGGMACYGFVTKRDLSSWGPVLFGALIGLLVSSVVFIFVDGTVFNLIIGWAGVIIFSGLTAYDMQKIKGVAAEAGAADEAAVRKMAIFGALQLYLDFINLFLSLLRIFGARK